MNTVITVANVVSKLIMSIAAAFGLVIGGVLLLDAINSDHVDPAVVEAKLTSDSSVQAFLGVPKSYKTSVNKTTAEFVAGWAEGMADQNPLVRTLGALTERQVEFIREEIAPRANYIEENNPPRIASEQFSAHADAIGKLVMAAR